MSIDFHLMTRLARAPLLSIGRSNEVRAFFIFN